jgi:hypothetical protein
LNRREVTGATCKSISQISEVARAFQGFHSYL